PWLWGPEGFLNGLGALELASGYAKAPDRALSRDRSSPTTAGTLERLGSGALKALSTVWELWNLLPGMQRPQIPRCQGIAVVLLRLVPLIALALGP
ncbi:MAG: hypothetical protein PVJ19_22545, partial [Desulfobacteraceae bacterium]